MKRTAIAALRVGLMSIAVTMALALVPRAAASDVQIKTSDGQTITGEFLGTTDGVIKVRSKYGEISIPSKDVLTMVKAPDSPAAVPARPDQKKDPNAIEAPTVKFAEPKDVNLSALLATRAPEPPEPNKQERQEIFRYIRNFRDSSDKSRAKAIDNLKGFGYMAYPFISSDYTTVDDLEDKIQMLAAVAVPGSPYSAGIFAKSHATALNEFKRLAAADPTPPPDYLTKKERELPSSQTSDIKAAARRVLAIEADASAAQGPFNTLFLFQVYKARYNGETDLLLHDVSHDKALIAASAGDAASSKSEWLGSDRVMLAEAAFPLLFGENADLKEISQALLKQILPANHPKFSASEEEWFNWWVKNKEKVEKK